MTNEDDFNPTARIAQITNKCYSKFWVVTNPTKDSTLADICFEADSHNLELQFKGGLSIADVCGFYISESAAKEAARNLISWAHPNEITGTYIDDLDKMTDNNIRLLAEYGKDEMTRRQAQQELNYRQMTGKLVTIALAPDDDPLFMARVRQGDEAQAAINDENSWSRNGF